MANLSVLTNFSFKKKLHLHQSLLKGWLQMCLHFKISEGLRVCIVRDLGELAL